MRETAAPTALGRTQAYLGRCHVEDVLRCREHFGGVTLQGPTGLRIARSLLRMGELWGVDLDPATYRTRPRRAAADQLTLPGLDCAELDWVRTQDELGLPVVRTAGPRIRAGEVEPLRAELNRSYPVEVSVLLALDGGWLGRRHIDALEGELRAADRDVSLVFAAAVDPVNTAGRVAALRRILRWARESSRTVELLRTDLVGLPAVLEGAAVAAIGMSTSTRHLGVPFGPRQRASRSRGPRSPLVFVPRLLHWQRANVLGGLAPWRGAGVTDCECPGCQRSGRDLLRFDAPDGEPPVDLGRQVTEHDSLALSHVITQVMASADPAAELRHRQVNAVYRATALSTSLPVRLDLPPAWLNSWQ